MGSILHWETWELPELLEGIMWEEQYKAYWEVQFSPSAELSHFLSAVAVLFRGCYLEYQLCRDLVLLPLPQTAGCFELSEGKVDQQ